MASNERDFSSIRGIFSRFSIESDILTASRHAGGHINETYLVRTANGDAYMLQRVNHHVFPRVPELMENVHRVTAHIEGKRTRGELPTGERSLNFLSTKSGKWYEQDETGGYWRVYRFVGNSRTYDTCDSPNRAHQAAAAFGRFMRYLEDLPGHALHATIDRYHDGTYRLEQLDRAVEDDVSGRVSSVSKELEFAFERRDFAGTLVTALREGRVPSRAVHNDTKLNNLLFDLNVDQPICVIDLDTCMAGSALFDFGDLARNTSVPTAEDEQDLDKVQVDRMLFQALVGGYISGAGGCLTDGELDLFSVAPRVFALTLGVRFLADYLRGDTYFRIHRENHNLERARTQFEIVRKMESADGWMRDMIEIARRGQLEFA